MAANPLLSTSVLSSAGWLRVHILIAAFQGFTLPALKPSGNLGQIALRLGIGHAGVWSCTSGEILVLPARLCQQDNSAIECQEGHKKLRSSAFQKTGHRMINSMVVLEEGFLPAEFTNT